MAFYAWTHFVLQQSDASDLSGSESEFEADPEDFEDVESSAGESDYSNASGSDDSGSDFGDGSESDEGMFCRLYLTGGTYLLA